MMATFQVFECLVIDLNTKKHGENKKMEAVAKWIIPVVSIALYIVTLEYGLGHKVDIRRVAVAIVGVILLATGNYLPKLDYIKNYNIAADKARKINRFGGYVTVILGVLFLISLFFPPIASVICLCLLIPYTLAVLVYSIKVIKKG